MSAYLNIATPAELAEKDAYINSDLVDAYIQENIVEEGGVTIKTYTLSFIKKDEEDPNLSEVVALDYARASDIPTKNYNEIIFKCTSISGGGGSSAFAASIVGYDSDLDETVTITNEGTGIYKISSSAEGEDLSSATAIVSSFEGVCLVEHDAEGGGSIKITTKEISNGAGSDPISYVAADGLLKETAIRVVIPIA